MEKLLPQGLKSVIGRGLNPNPKSGFTNKHAPIENVLQFVDVIERMLDHKHIYTIIFLDVVQAFENVWQECVEYQLIKLFPHQYVKHTVFSINYLELDLCKDLKNRTEFPQGSVFGPTSFHSWFIEVKKCDYCYVCRWY